MSLDDDLEPELQTAVLAELNWMGDTLLRIAQTRADAMYLATDVKIREGNIRTEIVQYLQIHETDLLFIGAPRGTTANVFGDDTIEQLAEMITKETAVPVEIVRPD